MRAPLNATTNSPKTSTGATGSASSTGVPPNEFALFFDYQDSGYVKDDDKNELDADKLMASMVESQERSYKARAKQGWDEMKFAAWASLLVTTRKPTTSPGRCA